MKPRNVSSFPDNLSQLLPIMVDDRLIHDIQTEVLESEDWVPQDSSWQQACGCNFSSIWRKFLVTQQNFINLDSQKTTIFWIKNLRLRFRVWTASSAEPLVLRD